MAKEAHPTEMRRVQLTGGSTFIISLPKNWVNEVGLKKGSFLSVLPQPDGSLSIVPQNATVSGAEGEEAHFSPVPGDDPEDVVREFIARYLAGYRMIKIEFRQQAARYKNHLKDAIRRKLIGVEIVDESGDSLTAQCLFYSTELAVKKALKRMGTITSAMQRDAISALKNLDKSFASEIISRDDEIDRFYFYIVRQLKMAVNNRSLLEEMEMKMPTDCLGYRVVVKSVERVADHAVRIADVTTNMDKPPQSSIYEEITKLSRLSNSLYEASLNALENLDVSLAQRIIDSTPEAARIEDEILENMLEMRSGAKSLMEGKVITHALKRIAEYASDISEMAINIAVEHQTHAKK